MGAPVWHCVFSQSPCLWSHTFIRMCTCISTWIYAHLHCPMSTPPPCIVWWKPGCTSMSVCLCPSHFISVLTLCLECVHASVHVFMSRWHPMLAKPLLIVTWKHGSHVWPLCVSESPCLWSHNLIKMCTCIISCIYVHLIYHVCFTPFE